MGQAFSSWRDKRSLGKVDVFYRTLFEQYQFNGLLPVHDTLSEPRFLERAEISSLNKIKLEFFIRHKNCNSLHYVLDFHPMPRVTFMESIKKQSLAKQSLAKIRDVLVDIQEEKWRFQQLIQRYPNSRGREIIQRLEIFQGADRVCIKYKIHEPAVEIRYFVCSLSKLQDLLAQVRTLCILYEQKIKETPPL